MQVIAVEYKKNALEIGTRSISFFCSEQPEFDVPKRYNSTEPYMALEGCRHTLVHEHFYTCTFAFSNESSISWPAENH